MPIYFEFISMAVEKYKISNFFSLKLLALTFNLILLKNYKLFNFMAIETEIYVIFTD